MAGASAHHCVIKVHHPSSWFTMDKLDVTSKLTMRIYHVYGHVYYIKLAMLTIPIGSMYAIYDNIYHQYTPNVSLVYIPYMDPMGYINMATITASSSRTVGVPQGIAQDIRFQRSELARRAADVNPGGIIFRMIFGLRIKGSKNAKINDIRKIRKHQLIFNWWYLMVFDGVSLWLFVTFFAQRWESQGESHLSTPTSGAQDTSFSRPDDASQPQWMKPTNLGKLQRWASWCVGCAAYVYIYIFM